MWRQVRRGRWQNADASNRAERPILYIVGGIALVALLAYLLLLRPQSFMVRGVVATLRHDGGVRGRHAMDQSVAAHGVRNAGRHCAGAHAIAGRIRAAAGAAGDCCGRASRSSGTRRSKWHSARSSAPVQAPRFIICDCRRACTFVPGALRTSRSSSRPSSEAARFTIRGSQAPGTPEAFREYFVAGSRIRASLHSSSGSNEPRELVGVVNLSEIVHGRFEARTSDTTRSFPTPGAA